MNKTLFFLCCIGIFFLQYGFSSEELPPNRLHIAYLMQTKEYDKAFDLYTLHAAHLKKHDFELLEQMSYILLEHAAESKDPQRQLLSIFGSQIAGISIPSAILSSGITSPNLQSQLAALQCIGRMQDDKTEELLMKAMSSDFLYTRLEAAYILSLRRTTKAAGIIESLMHKLPSKMHFFFPEFFAAIGTKESIVILKHLMDEPFYLTRVQAILSAARHQRDDLLPKIRACSSQLNKAQQEACAAALGYLKDSSSLRRLKKLSCSPLENVRLAALKALHGLGDSSALDRIGSLAEEKNLFAIELLGEFPGKEDLLFSFVKDKNLQIRFNATFSLLQRRDKRCLPTLYEFLVQDSKDLGFQLQPSAGHSLFHWKVIPSLAQHSSSQSDLPALSLSLREQMLRDCLELGEAEFLNTAKMIFLKKQNSLVPVLVSLLENMNTPEAIALLKDHSQMMGAPLIRGYCFLALFRLQQAGPYEAELRQWVKENLSEEIIQLRPTLPWNMRLKEDAFELSTEEKSALLIQSLQALCEQTEKKNIDFLIEAMQNGNVKNRPVFAGMLLHALQ